MYVSFRIFTNKTSSLFYRNNNKISFIYHQKSFSSTFHVKNGKTRNFLIDKENEKGKLLSKESMFSVDWSALSPKGLGYIFREFFADLVGAPPPPPLTSEEFDQVFGYQKLKSTDLNKLYDNPRLHVNAQSGFLIRGIIYHSSSLIIKKEKLSNSNFDKNETKHNQNPIETNQNLSPVERKRLERAEMAKQDWESFVLGITDKEKAKEKEEESNEPKSPVRNVASISTEELAAQLGLDNYLESKTEKSNKHNLNRTISSTSSTSDVENQKSKESDVMLNLNRFENIRSKYAAKLKEKRILAESRLEHGGVQVGHGSNQIIPSAKPKVTTGNAKDWLAMPGSANLVRHFRERGIQQALLVGLGREDLLYFQDQLLNFPFSPNLKIKPQTGGKALSRELLDEICKSWKLKPNQILVVFGGTRTNNEMLNAAKNGYFLCQMCNSSDVDNCQTGNTTETSPNPQTLNYSSQNESNSNFKVKPNQSIEVKDSPNNSPLHVGATMTNGQSQSKVKPNQHAGIFTVKNKFDAVRKQLGIWYDNFSRGDFDNANNISRTQMHNPNAHYVHFSASETSQLKFIVEQMNGVSYRNSTFVRNQNFNNASFPALSLSK